MKKKNARNFIIAAVLVLLFFLWTAVVITVDVKQVEPNGTTVGLSRFNSTFHSLTGVNMTLYNVTDLLSLIPLLFVAGFAILGLQQLIRRKCLLKVDYSILVLGCFYVIVITAFLLFEAFIVNYRPILIEGRLEASYPSSTTMLVMCVIPTSAMQLSERINNKRLRVCINSLLIIFLLFMVIGRLISGVHWISDIIGGVLLSSGLVMTYYSVKELK